MRFHTWMTMGACSFALAFGGCAESDTGESVAQSDQTAASSVDAESERAETVTAQKVVQEAEDTLDAAGDLAAETQDEYIRKANEKLADLDKRMEDLQRRAGTLTDEAAADWETAWSNLQDQRREMQERLDELQAASGDAWGDLRQGTDAAWDELQKAFNDASSHFDEDQESSESESAAADMP